MCRHLCFMCILYVHEFVHVVVGFRRSRETMEGGGGGGGGGAGGGGERDWEGEGGERKRGGWGDRLSVMLFKLYTSTMYFQFVNLISHFHFKHFVLTRGEAHISIHHYYYQYYCCWRIARYPKKLYIVIYVEWMIDCSKWYIVIYVE